MNKQTEKAIKDLIRMEEELNNNSMFKLNKKASYNDNLKTLIIYKDTQEDGIKGTYKSFMFIDYSTVSKNYNITVMKDESNVFIDNMTYRDCAKIASHIL